MLQSAISPQNVPQMKADVWENFDEKLNELTNYHNRYGQANLIAIDSESLDAEALFNKIMDEDVIAFCEKHFTAEEGNGKYLDLHQHYLAFCNLKKLKSLNVIRSDDYLSWLQQFDKLYLVPLYLKNSTKYEEYLKGLKDYLVDFFKKTQPLLDWTKIEE